MEFSELTEGHLKFRQEIREFVEKNITPLAMEIDRKSEFPSEIIKQMGQRGYLGIPYPKEYGGLGLDVLSYAIGVEEVSKVCASTGITMAAHCSLGAYPVYLVGTDSQKEKFLVPMVKGKVLGGFGLTETNAGSDAAATETTAKEVENNYLINGSKKFNTSGGVAGFFNITATHDKSKGVHGISAFIVERERPGFSVGKEEDKLGLRGSNTVELIFEDCLVPKENLLGNKYEGFKVFMKTLDGGRISIGAFALGIAQGALEASVKYVREHSLKSQLVQKMIADMSTEIEAARHLVYHAAYLEDHHGAFTKESAMAKLFASEVCLRAANFAIQIHGPEGLTKKYPVERFYRDGKLAEIGEGTSEIQRLVIARQILGRY
ncbi:MAG: acyl-CoA dehydrogenase family protein [Candidatus Edwardsbacteria bacterium]